MDNKTYYHGAVFKVTRDDDRCSIEQNLKQMKESGFNTVVVWPAFFWWEEKAEGYPFNTGRYILEKAEEIGLKIVMELAGQITTNEYMPDFLMKKEYYALTEQNSIEFGQPSFGFINYFHPEVNKIICDNFKDTAKAYKDYPALLGYDVFNETMYRSFDEYTIEEFRVWLREKYGTIENLNRVWERTYSDFSEVTYQKWKWLSVMPEADYYQFRKAAITRFMKNWCNAIREVDNEHPLIADNIHSMVTAPGSYDRPQDDFRLQDAVDIIGMSFYPKSPAGVFEPAMRWEIFEGMYSASRRKGFMLSEMQTHIQAIFNPTTAVYPHELKHWCYEAISSGAKGLVYWMWRPFTRGLQTMGRGLVDYKNRPTVRLDVAKEISEFFSKTNTLAPQKAKVAIVFEDFTEDLQKTYTRAYDVDEMIYINAIYGAYKAFFDAKIPCDIIRIDEIENYETVILVNELVMGKSVAEKLKKFVEKGGNVIIDGKTGIVDEESTVLHTVPGGDFNSYTGIDYIDSDYQNLEINLGGKTLQGYYSKDLVDVIDATVEATFSDGKPAIVSKTSGGTVLTFNTQLFYGYEKTGDKTVLDYVKGLGERFNLNEYELEGDVNVKICENDQEYVVFIFNYTDSVQTGKITFCGKTEEFNVNANDVIVLKRGK